MKRVPSKPRPPTGRRITKRAFFLGLLSAPALAQDVAWPTLPENSIILLRHATAPGVGDPAGFRLEDCSTQRNLSEAGRAQARAIGENFRRRGIAVGQVLTSQWCRAKDTASLAFPGQVREESAFNSIFTEDPAAAASQTAHARAILEAWRGPGVLIVVTHQVNIAALTRKSPASGDGVIMGNDNGTLVDLGSFAP